MTMQKPKALSWKKTINDLVHMNTMRLTFKLWHFENTKGLFRSAKDKAEFKEVKKILRCRATKLKHLIANKIHLERKRRSKK